MIFNEPESVLVLFLTWGMNISKQKQLKIVQNKKDDSLKTTSVRMHEKQLTALDAVCRGISMTRQDAIQLAVRQFIGDAVRVMPLVVLLLMLVVMRKQQVKK